MGRAADMRPAASCGFTLIEVLVALALVATVLGGTLGVVRESIDTQRHLERRMLAEWAASNVLDQYLLEHDPLNVESRQGTEAILGRSFRYSVAVTEKAAPPSRGLTKAPDNNGATPPLVYQVAVEVRDGGKRSAPLARMVRERRGAATP